MSTSRSIVDPAASESTIDQVFTDEYNKAFELYEEDHVEECEGLARKLLDDPAIPSYHHMKALLLLAAVVHMKDWDEANECLIAAEKRWHIVKQDNHEGEDKIMDEAMAEIRKQLEDLTEILADSAAQSGLEEATAGTMTTSRAGVEDATGRITNFNTAGNNTTDLAIRDYERATSTDSEETTTNNTEQDNPEVAFWEQHHEMIDLIRKPASANSPSKEALAREQVDNWEAKSDDLVEIIADFDPEAAASMAQLKSKLMSVAVNALNKHVSEDQASS